MNLTELIRLARRRGVLLDTNLLLLYLFTIVDDQQIGRKRLSQFTHEDSLLLRTIISDATRLFTTPHVLTEVSNLARQQAREDKIMPALAQFILLSEERFVSAGAFQNDPLFLRLGVTDTALATTSFDGGVVLSTDYELVEALQRRDHSAANFNHMRKLQ